MKNDIEDIEGYLKVGESKTESIGISEDWKTSENSNEDILIDFYTGEIVVNRACLSRIVKSKIKIFFHYFDYSVVIFISVYLIN